MADHRKPPKEHYKNISGKCNHCGETVYRGGEKAGTEEGKGCWHHECIHDYKLLHWPQYAREVIFKRDKGVCAHCGYGKPQPLRDELSKRISQKYHTQVISHEQYMHYWRLLNKKYPFEYGTWELDHITPLIDGGSFGTENMQTLCHICHKVKTAREATERANRRKGQTSLFNQEKQA